MSPTNAAESGEPAESAEAAETAETARPSDTGAEREGGESACWLDRVCPQCDAVADSPPPTRCPRCGAELP